MSAFNTVVVDTAQPCTRCAGSRVVLQFKYGHTRQLEYTLGNTVQWGGNDRGQRGLAQVNVDSCVECCATCGLDSDDLNEDRPWTLRIENDILRWARPATPEENALMGEGADYRGWYTET